MVGQYLVWAWEEKKTMWQIYRRFEGSTGARMEEEDHAESLKHLQHNRTLSKSEWK